MRGATRAQRLIDVRPGIVGYRLGGIVSGPADRGPGAAGFVGALVIVALAVAA